MTDLFIRVLNMSIAAGWIVLAVVVLRLLLHKAPRWIMVALWGIVALRLICPFSLESVLSLIPSAQTVSPEIMMDPTPTIESGVPIVNNAVNPIIESTLTPHMEDSVNPLQIWIPVASVLWLAGIAALLVYTVVSYLRLRYRVSTAVRLRDNVFLSEKVASPFVLGVVRPKIYLPYNISAEDMQNVIAHEQAHISRRDHWIKPFGFLLLTVHWFNPLVWWAYVLLCRDIELACDQKVVQQLPHLDRAAYSEALLRCAVRRRTIAACPLAFGEVGVKNRIKAVLSYKKPTVWILVAAILMGTIAGVCFLTNPPTGDDNTVTTQADDLKSVAKLRELYPQFFGLSADDGLLVYIWQMGEDNYRCYLTTVAEDAVSDQSFAFSHQESASITDMCTILATYPAEQDTITIRPVQNPLSSYHYEIDGAYTQKVKERFWAVELPFIQYEMPQGGFASTIVLDGAPIDIDGDGKLEYCVLRSGSTLGEFTFSLAAYDGCQLLYSGVYSSPEMQLSLMTPPGVPAYLQGITADKYVRKMDLSIDEQRIVISSDEQDVMYVAEWGKPQELTSITTSVLTGTISYTQLTFSKGNGAVAKAASKTAFTQPIACTYDGESIQIQAPQFTGIPVDAVWSHKKFYEFVDGTTIFDVATEDGTLYCKVDTNGTMTSTDTDYLRLASGRDIGKYLPKTELRPEGRLLGDEVEVRQFGEFGSYTQYLYSTAGECLSDAYDTIGYFFNGLALVTKDKKVGLIDEKGNEVLTPSIAYDTVAYGNGLEWYPAYMFEDAFVLPIGGEFAVIRIQRANASNAQDETDRPVASYVPYSDVSADKLTDKQAQEIMGKIIPRQLEIIFTLFSEGDPELLDDSQRHPADEMYVLVKDERFSCVQDVKDYVLSIWTKEGAQEWIFNSYFDNAEYPKYIDYQGKLYFSAHAGGKGFIYNLLPETTRIVKRSGNVLNLEMDTRRSGDKSNDDIWLHTPTLVKTANGWRISNGLHEGKDTPSEQLYADFLNTLKKEEIDRRYTFKDMDGNRVEELLIKEGTTLHVYTYQGGVKYIGKHDFVTGTLRMFNSDDTRYPGIFYFTVGGGANHYDYMTIRYQRLVTENVWEDRYGLEAEGSAERIKKFTTDEDFIAESKRLYDNDCDMQFTPLRE